MRGRSGSRSPGFDVRRALNDTALLLRNSAEVHDGHIDRRRRAADRAVVSRPTRTRSSRSSGTWPPTACARCPTAAACSSVGAVEPASDGVVITVQDEGIGIRAGGARRPVPAVSRQLREGQRPRAGDRPPHRDRLPRRDPGQLAARRGHHGVGAAAGAGGSRRHDSDRHPTGSADHRAAAAADPGGRRRAVDAGAAGDRAAARRLRGAAGRERPRRRSTLLEKRADRSADLGHQDARHERRGRAARGQAASIRTSSGS